MFKRHISSKTLRRRTSWIITAVLILPFVLFFHATGRAPTRGPGGSAGTVFGKSIPWEEFQQQRVWLRRQWEGRFGSIPESMEPLLIQSTWDRFMLVEEARRRRVRVDDRELAAFIERLPAFQEQGRFLPERYHRYLQALGVSAELFEEMLRNDLLVEKLINSLKGSISVSDDEVKAAYTTAHERLKAAAIVVEASSFADKAAAGLTDEEIRADYDTHANEVRIPEQLVMEYAGLSREELTTRVQLSDQELSDFYQDHRDLFTKEDGTLKPLEEVREDVRARAVEQRVHKQLATLALDLEDDREAQVPFAETVKTRALTQHSAGPLPAGNPWIPGGPEPALLQAVSDLAEGQLSGVVTTDRGVYLARVTQRIPSRVPPLDEVKAQIRDRLIQERAREAARAQANTVRAHLQEEHAAGLRVDEAAAKLGVALKRPAPFTRTESIESLGNVPAVNQTAFDTALGALTEVLETPTGFVLVYPEERVPPDDSKLAGEASALRQETLNHKQTAQLERWLADLRARATLRSFVE